MYDGYCNFILAFQFCVVKVKPDKFLSLIYHLAQNTIVVYSVQMKLPIETFLLRTSCMAENKIVHGRGLPT